MNASKVRIIALFVAVAVLCGMVYAQVREVYTYPQSNAKYRVYEHVFDEDDFDFSATNVVLLNPDQDPNSLDVNDVNVANLYIDGFAEGSILFIDSITQVSEDNVNLRFIDANDFLILANILMRTNGKFLLRDTAIGIYSQADTFMDLFADGGIRVGDSSAGAPTNYAQFAADGELTLVGNARVEKYLIFNAAILQKGVSAPDTGTEGTFSTLLFASNLTEDVRFNVHIPADWSTGTDLEVAIYWSPTDTTDANGVGWEFDWEAVASEANEILGAGSTHVNIHDLTQGVDNELLETGYGEISGASLAADDTIGIHLYRDHDDSNDVYSFDAALIHIEIEYIADKLGVAL